MKFSFYFLQQTVRLLQKTIYMERCQNLVKGKFYLNVKFWYLYSGSKAAVQTKAPLLRGVGGVFYNRCCVYFAAPTGSSESMLPYRLFNKDGGTDIEK